MKTKRIPLTRKSLLSECKEFKKSELYDPNFPIDCRKDSFMIFNSLVDRGFLTRTGERRENLREKLELYTVVHSFTGDSTIFDEKDFESFTRGLAGQANVVGLYFDVPTAYEKTVDLLQEKIARRKIQGRFRIEPLERVEKQMQNQQNFVFGTISNEGTIESFTLHRNFVDRTERRPTDLRALYREEGLKLTTDSETTYQGQNLEAFINDVLKDESVNYSSPERAMKSAHVFYAPNQDVFVFAFTGRKIKSQKVQTDLLFLKLTGGMEDLLKVLPMEPSTQQEQKEYLQEEYDQDIIEL